MTVLSHWVIDDLGGESGTVVSRVGVLEATFGTVVGGSYVETYAPRDKMATEKAHARDSADQGIGSGAVVGSTRANCLVPVVPDSPVRTYELILRNRGFTAVDGADSGDGVCQVKVTNDGDLQINIFSDTENITLEVAGAMPSAETEKYQHVAIVLDMTDINTTGATAKIYVDGELIGSDSEALASPPLPWTDDLYVDGEFAIFSGTNSGGGGNGFVEMMVHDVELTATQIQQRSFNMRAVNAFNNVT